MARPLRLEYPGALYHVTSRGNAGQKIFRNDKDRLEFLELLGRSVERSSYATASHDLSARNRTIHAAHVVHHYTLKEIGDHVRLHYTTVSRIIRNQHRMLQRKT